MTRKHGDLTDQEILVIVHVHVKRVQEFVVFICLVLDLSRSVRYESLA